MKSIFIILLLLCIFSIGVFVGDTKDNNFSLETSEVISTQNEPEMVDKETILQEVKGNDPIQQQNGNVFLLADKAAAISSWVFDQVIYGTEAIIETINSSKSTS